MLIKNWQITSGQRTFDLRMMQHVLLAALLVAIAIGVQRLMGPSFKGVSDLLALLAILFAAIQYIDARIQKHEINRIAKTMSTQFIGVFPKNLPEITDVIGKAERNVCIITDFVSYGHYSFPAAFSRYLSKIQEARERKANVRIICYDKQLSDKEIEDQFTR